MKNKLRNLILNYVPPSYLPTIVEFYRFLRGVAYLGNQYQCPCCKWRFRKLYTPHPQQPNAICPRCGAFERHRWLVLYLEDKQQLFGNVLHFAPMASVRRYLLNQPGLTYFSTDISISREYRLNLCMDMTFSAFVDEGFDAILCSHVLEHVVDDTKAIAELYRIMKPGAWAVVNVPIIMDRLTYEDPTITSPKDRLQAFGQSDHVRIYGHDYVERLTDAGFQVERLSALSMSPDLVKRHALNVNEPYFVVTKPN